VDVKLADWMIHGNIHSKCDGIMTSGDNSSDRDFLKNIAVCKLTSTQVVQPAS